MAELHVEWPPNLRVSDRTDPMLGFNNRSAGVGMDGSEQILSPLSSIWRRRIIVPIRDQAAIRSIRKIKASLKGRFNYLLIGADDAAALSRRNVGTWSDGRTTHSDHSFFSDGASYETEFPNSLVVANAAAGVSEIQINSTMLGDYMSSGVFLSINEWFYQVEDWSLDGDVFTLEIAPPLRSAILVDDVVDFRARALWRLAEDDTGSLDLASGKHGYIELALVEPVERG